MHFKAFIKDAGFRNHVLVLFATMCVTRLGFDISGGEEHYLTFAKQFSNPDWIPGSFTATEYPGTRIVFQWLVGPVLSFMDMESFAFLARGVNFFLLSIPLALVFRKLKIGIPESFVLLQLFVMSEQNLFGGEWIIKSFEPKSIAYIFVFYALHSLLEKKYTRMAIFLAIGTYFHILVGGWVLIGILVVWAFSQQWKRAFMSGLIFGLLCLPFAIYVFIGYFLNAPEAGEINPDWVYCYYRLAKHLGIFYFKEFFMSTHFTGIVLSAFALIVAFLLKRKFTDENLRLLANLVIAFLFINMIFVGVAYVDHAVLDNAGSLGLKYYPFRSNSIASFLLFLLVFIWIRDVFGGSKIYLNSLRVIFGLVVLLGVVQGVNNVKRTLALDQDFKEVCVFINENTAKGSQFGLIGEGRTNRVYWGFMRQAERENFSETKFIPADKHKIEEWYYRNVDHVRMNKDPRLFIDIANKHSLQYLLIDRSLEQPGLDLLYENDKYFVYGTGIDIPALDK